MEYNTSSSSSSSSSSSLTITNLDQFIIWSSTHLNLDLQSYSTKETLIRYLVAYNDDIEKAKKALEVTIEWRKVSLKINFFCNRCKINKGAHCFIPLGEDTCGNVIIYGCPARASETNVEETINHCIHALEKQFSTDGAKRWIWLVDFKGFGLIHSLNARLGICFASIFKAHYPERLKAILLINPPFIFKALLSAIGSIADERTLNKLVQINETTGQEVVRELDQRFGLSKDIQIWLQDVFDMDDITPYKVPPLPQTAQSLQV